uniref:Uncharacterized protein n=1 Tax=Romanomermis culicivorax TaxID=13658 RepID=A0A915JM68_ROMCU
MNFEIKNCQEYNSFMNKNAQRRQFFCTKKSFPRMIKILIDDSKNLTVIRKIRQRNGHQT